MAAADLDPSGKTAVCAAVDAAGTAVGSTFTVIEDVQAVAALLSKTAPKLPATSAALKAGVTMRVQAKTKAEPNTASPRAILWKG